MEHFRDESLSFEERAADLTSRMALEEKISWCGAWTSPIRRLGILMPATKAIFPAVDGLVHMKETCYVISSGDGQVWNTASVFIN